MKSFVLLVASFCAVGSEFGLVAFAADIDCYVGETTSNALPTGDSNVEKGYWCTKTYNDMGTGKVSVTRGKVSEEHVKKMNDEGYGLELGCDSSSLWNVKTTECYCNEAKCNGAAGVRSDGSVGLKTLLITISMAAFFLTKP